MANQFEKGRTFNPGDTVEAADLNNLVDHADALKGLILEAIVDNTPVPNLDSVLYYSSDATDLRRCLIQHLPSGVSTVTLTTESTTIFDLDNPDPNGPAVTMDVTFKNQSAGKVLASPASGSAAAPTFRALAPSDLPVGTVDLPAFVINWSLGNMFSKTNLTASGSFTFSNASAGQTIRVLVRQDVGAPPARTIGFVSPVRWPGGTPPVLTPDAGHFDLITLHFINGTYWGTFEQDFLIP